MRSKTALIITLIGIALFYSLILYALSFAPFLGLEFDNYWFSLLSFVVVFLVNTLFVVSYYHFYDKVSLLRLYLTKYITGFLLSLLTFYVWDLFVDGVSVHILTKVVLSFFFMFAFSDDPNSFRSLKRTMKKTQGK